MPLDGSTYPGCKMRCFSQLILFLAIPNVTHYMRDQCYHYKVIEPRMSNFLMLNSFYLRLPLA